MAKKKEPAAEVVEVIKGFDKNLQCRGYQFEIGKTFKHEGEVKACESGFHSVEYPLDVFAYYPPAESRYATATASGALSRHDDDSKIASAQITISAEIKIPELITRAFNFVLDRCDKKKSNHVTGYRSASSATGDSSASSATGDSSASSATGYRSASSATGYRSASSATGYRSASSATGYSSASSATGYSSASITTGSFSSSEITADEDGKALHAVSIAAGYESKASAPEGSAIVCVFRNDKGELLHIRASKVGENGIKPNTFYTLDAAGEFMEA